MDQERFKFPMSIYFVQICRILIENGADPENASNLFVNDRKYYVESNIIDDIVIALRR